MSILSVIPQCKKHLNLAIAIKISRSMATLQLTPQKEYYRWKNVNFCCVCGDDKSPSRFTKDLRFSALLVDKKSYLN